MIDSTDFHEAYDSTREVLQNVPPDTAGIVAAAVILGIVIFLGISRKVGIINLNSIK